MKTRTILSLLVFLSLIFFFSCNKKEDTKPLPTAVFTASDTSVVVGQQITFTNTSENATSYSWSFGDGTYSTAKNPVHTYSKARKYTVSLTVKNAKGSNTKTISNYITVK